MASLQSLFTPKGMGIDGEEVQATVRPSGIGQGGVRGFSAAMPHVSYDAEIQAGKQLGQLGEDLMRAGADRASREAANSAKIEKDPVTGEWKRPSSPLLFGIMARQQYDQIVDQRFTEEVYRDTERQLDEVATAHFNQPEIAAQKMSAIVEGTLKNVPENMRGRLGPILGREYNERQRGIMSTYQHEQWRNEVSHLTDMVQFRTNRAWGFMASGDEARAQEEMALGENAVGRLTALHAQDPRALSLQQQRWHSMTQGAKVLQAFNAAAERGDATVYDGIQRVQQMLRGGNEKDEVYGITQKDLFGSILSQQERDQLAVRLGQIGDDYLKKQAAASQVKDVAGYKSFYDTYGRVGKNQNLSDQQDELLTRAFVHEQGWDPFAGSTVEKLWRMRGDVPKGFYGALFDGAQSKDPMYLARAAEAYKAIVNLKAPDGRTVGDPAGILKDSDAAYMHLFTRALEQAEGYGSGDAAKMQDAATRAAKQASDLYRAGVDTLKEAKDPVYLVNDLRKQNGEPEMTKDKVVADITSRIAHFDPLPNALKTLAGAPAYPQTADAALTRDQREAMMQSVAGLMVTGQMSYEQAVEQTRKRFEATHERSGAVLAPGGKPGGWVSTHFAVPKINDVRRGGAVATDEWADGYINRLFELGADGTYAGPESKTPLIARRQNGFDLKEPKLRQNLFLVPQGGSTANPDFKLFYVPEGHPELGFTLKTGTGRDVVLRLGDESKVQAEAAARALANPDWKRQFDDREARLGGYDMGSPSVGVLPLAAPADPLKILDPSVLAPNQAPEGEGGGRGRGRGGKALDLSTRRDGMPGFLTPIDGLNPDVPAMKGGKVSLETGGDGFRIPGLDDGTHYTLSAFKAPHAHLVVENGAGPRAGQTVSANPELASGLAAMLNDMPKELQAGFRINSMVRSYDQQETIYRSTVAKRGEANARHWAALPGHSLHETGRAADLGMDRATAAWVHQNAERYGLHFPLAHEPWHIEPITARRKAALDTEADSEFA